MNCSPEESDAQRLVFRERSHPFIGLPLLILGLSILVGTGPEIVRRWPHLFGPIAGVFLGLFLTMFGMALMSCRRVVFDRAERRLVDTRRLLFLKRSKIRGLAGFKAIGWTKRMESDGEGQTAWFPVVLRGEGADLQIFKVRSAADARRLTSEVGDFLSLEQSHWDAAVLDRSSELGQEYRRKQARAVSMVRAFGGMPAMRMDVSDSGSLAILRRKASGCNGGFLRLFGTLALVLGVFFMLLPLIGGTFNGRKDAFWEPILIGLVMVLVGSSVAFARRGTTLDKDEQVVRVWWGLPGLLWSRQYDLYRFSAVVFDEFLPEADLVGRVFLKGDDVPDLVLHMSMDVDEARSLAEELARFLGFHLVSGSPRPVRSS